MIALDCNLNTIINPHLSILMYCVVCTLWYFLYSIVCTLPYHHSAQAERWLAPLETSE